MLTNGQVHATPAVQNGIAFIAGCDSLLRAIRVSDGRQMYQIDSGAYTGASPLIVGTRAYYGTFNNEVLAADLAKRRILWRYTNPDRKFPFYSSAASTGTRIILGGRDKYVHALDASTGKPAWTFATRARVDSSPAVSAGRVYIGSGDGRLYVLDAQNGTKLFEFDAGAGISASPAVAGGRVVIGTQDGRLYVQSFPPHEEHPEAKAAQKGLRFTKALQTKMAQGASQAGMQVDWTLVEQVVNAANGIAMPVSQPAFGVDAYLASALLVENTIPDGANWDGTDRPVPIRSNPITPAPVAAADGQ